MQRLGGRNMCEPQGGPVWLEWEGGRQTKEPVIASYPWDPIKQEAE